MININYKKDWSLGMESISYCATEILIEIQRSIKILKWKCKEISQYYFHIYVINQTTWNIENRFKNKYASFAMTIIGIQLYKKDSCYFLDFHRVSGELFTFLVSCNLLADELKYINK